MGPALLPRAKYSEVLQASRVLGIPADRVGSSWLLPRLGKSGGQLNEVWDLELGLNLSEPQILSVQSG